MKKYRSAEYHYRPSVSMRKNEVIQYRKTVLIIFITILCILFLYFIGIPLVANIDTFWGMIRGNSSDPAKTEEAALVPEPIIDMLPKITNQPKTTIIGQALPGYTIRLNTQNEIVAQVVVDQSGLFSFSEIILTEGKNDFSLLSVYGGRESRTVLISIEYDKTLPLLSIENPANNQIIDSDQASFSVEGMTEPTATLLINDHQVIVDSTGKFSYKLALVEGENKISALAADEAGNVNKVEVTVTFIKSTKPKL